MTPETAAQAAQLLRDIGILQGKVDAIGAAMENSHFIAGGLLPTDNPEIPIDLPPMTVDESKAIFGAAMNILGMRLKAMTATLANL
jgi:hypothetical protein